MKLNNLAVFGVLCAAAMLAGCGPSRSSYAGTSTATGIKALLKDSTGQEILPGDEVMLTQLGYGCESRDMLARAIEEQNLGRMSDLQKTIGNYPECITQNEFPGQHWTVTAIRPPVVQIGAVSAEDVRAFKKTAPKPGKPGAENYKNRYWIPPQWLLKINSK
ncbi:MAG: hypothetical protein ACRESR_02305 [Gammaproteobacteria bacterium]